MFELCNKQLSSPLLVHRKIHCSLNFVPKYVYVFIRPVGKTVLRSNQIKSGRAQEAETLWNTAKA